MGAIHLLQILKVAQTGRELLREERDFLLVQVETRQRCDFAHGFRAQFHDISSAVNTGAAHRVYHAAPGASAVYRTGWRG